MDVRPHPLERRGGGRRQRNGRRVGLYSGFCTQMDSDLLVATPAAWGP